MRKDACVVAWLGSLVYSGVTLSLNQHGAGIHQWNVPVTEMKMFGELNYVAQILFGPQVFTTKLAILLHLSRVFGVNIKMLWTVRALIFLMAVYYIPATAVKIFICWPVASFWDPLANEGTCLDEFSILFADCIISVVSDFTILLLPIPVIWGLQTRTMRKIGISAIFGAGILACSASVMRLYETIHLSRTQDTTYDLLPILLWSIVEIDIGIVCGCLPIVPSFIKKFSKAPTSKDSSKKSTVYQLDRICVPKRNIEDSTIRTQAGPGESSERLTAVQSKTVQDDQGNSKWHDDGIMKMV
ncbi:hypothetical protein DSL72_008137 [Monilinia vaccinii-corymbosi]|uniref:Rhodopsin domain-containing protein n=1 Tax=Monilinia vaccinii-corymbosi TaxID=61207 RepID=A0A8A3PJ15_9HELO|nr:hypothetical protein DSL72_008137 [Monilinia vaccinii-corymbosi]